MIKCRIEVLKSTKNIYIDSIKKMNKTKNKDI